jgi:hypothetical protein
VFEVSGNQINPTRLNLNHDAILIDQGQRGQNFLRIYAIAAMSDFGNRGLPATDTIRPNFRLLEADDDIAHTTRRSALFDQ